MHTCVQFVLLATIAMANQKHLKRFQTAYREGAPSSVMFIVGRGSVSLRAAEDDQHIGIAGGDYAEAAQT